MAPLVKLVWRLAPFTVTSDVGTKFAPWIVMFAGSPAGILVGVMDKMEGTGAGVAATVRSTVCEVPPPGAGVTTCTLIVPGVVTSPGFTIVVSSEGERKIVCRGAPLKVIVELGANPEPNTSNVKVTEFSGTLEGDSELTAGTGRLITPPQEESKTSATASIPAEIFVRRLNSSVLLCYARILAGSLHPRFLPAPRQTERLLEMASPSNQDVRSLREFRRRSAPNGCRDRDY